MLRGKSAKLKNNYTSRSKSYYQSKKYTNPFFQDTKKRRRRFGSRLNKDKIIFSLCLVFMGLLIWFFMYSGYFAISATEVKGEGRIDPGLIEKIVWEQIGESYFIFLPQKNIFIFNKNKLRAAIQEKFALSNLEIEKKLPNKIIIRFIEKEYALIWQEGERYYYGDVHGDIITELANILDVNKSNYPLIQNQKSEKLEADLAGIEAPYLEYILNLFQILAAHKDNLPLDYFIIDNEQNKVKIKLLDGPKLYFNINEDANKQINKVLVVKEEKLKNDFFKKEYIDVSIGDSVYYR